jgi:hypothetical protein
MVYAATKPEEETMQKFMQRLYNYLQKRLYITYDIAYSADYSDIAMTLRGRHCENAEIMLMSTDDETIKLKIMKKSQNNGNKSLILSCNTSENNLKYTYNKITDFLIAA